MKKNACSRVRPLAALAVIAALMAGCATSSPSPTAPSSTSTTPATAALTSGDLAGTWTVSAIEPAGEASQPAPPDAPYALTFAGDRLSTRVDCNTCSGGYSLIGQTLTAGPLLACTRAFCSTADFERAYTTILSGDSTVTRAGDALVLSSSRGTIRLSR